VSCSCAAIVLLAPHDWITRAIDLATGRRGWSHCFVDPGWAGVDPAVIDVSRTHGVQWSRWSRVVPEGIRTKRLPLRGGVASHVLGSLTEHMGRPYSIATMLVQPLQISELRARGVYCSGVVRDCLPRELRSLLPSQPSPSDLLAILPALEAAA